MDSESSNLKTMLKRDTSLIINWANEPIILLTNCHSSLSEEEKYQLELYPEDKEIASFAYLLYEKDEEQIKKRLNESSQHLSTDVNPFDGWTLLCTASNTKLGYFGAAFFRDGNFSRHRQITICHRGTLSGSFQNWISTSEGIVSNFPTVVMVSACTFAQEVYNVYKSRTNTPVQIILTGHGLGGWLAQISCFSLKYLELLDNGFECVDSNRVHPHCICFDSPGSFDILKVMNEATVKVDLRLDIINYVIHPNMVNVINEHFGDLVKIPTDCDKELFTFPVDITIRNLVKLAKHTDETHSMPLFLNLLGSNYAYVEEESGDGNSNWFSSTWNSFTQVLTRQTVQTKPRELKRAAKPLVKISKNWPLVRYSGPKPLTLGTQMSQMLNWGITSSQEYILNPGTVTIVEEYSRLRLPRCRVSILEETVIDTISSLPIHYAEEDYHVFGKVVEILLPAILPLLKLMKDEVWPVRKEVDNFIFENEAALICFKNIVLWNEFPMKTPSTDLWQWVKRSVKYYQNIKNCYILPEFDQDSPTLENEAVIEKTEDELILLILGILGKNDGTIFLKFLEKDEEHFPSCVKFLKEHAANSSVIVIDFSQTNQAEMVKRERVVDGERLKIYYLIPAITSSNEKQFTLTESSLNLILEKEVICQDVKKRKKLSDLVDAEDLKVFLAKHSDVTLSLFKKDEEFRMHFLSKTVFDSVCTYFQVGEIYQYNSNEKMIGLLEYYRRDSENSNLTIVVFVPNTKADLEVLKKHKDKILNDENVIIHVIEDTSNYFYAFTRICKLNQNSYVDLIRCRISSERMSEWRFEHLYQYNPKFFCKRRIIPPPLSLTQLCKLGQTVNPKMPGVFIGEKRVKYENLPFAHFLSFERINIRGRSEESESSASSTYKSRDYHETSILDGILREQPPVKTIRLNHAADGSLKVTVIKENKTYDLCISKSPPFPERIISYGEENFCILSCDPGMGKSTTMLNILPNLLRNYNIVTLLDLNNISDLDSLVEDFDLASFVRFVSKNLKLDTFSDFLFEEMLLKKRYKLTVVFDHYEKMEQKQRQVFKEALLNLRNNQFRKLQVIISTGCNEQEELEVAMCTLSHTLFPIKSVRDQANFLANFWAGILRCKKDNLLPLGTKIIEMAHQNLPDGRESFLGVPLQLKILGESSLPLARKWLNNDMKNDSQDFDSRQINLGKIYENFLNRKLEIYSQQKLGCLSANREFIGMIENAILPTLYWLAGNVLDLGDSFFYLSNSLSISFPDTFQRVLETGIIIRSPEGKKYPEFVHKSFAEYYAAKCLHEIVRKIFLRNDVEKCSETMQSHFFRFVFKAFVENGAEKTLLKGFFTSLIMDNPRLYDCLNKFKLKTNVPVAIELVTKYKRSFLSVRDQWVAEIMMNGWRKDEITNFVEGLHLHLSFIIEEKLQKVNVGLSAVLRRFCKNYNDNFMLARCLCRVTDEFSPTYFSLNDAIEFFNEQCSQNNPFAGESIQDFIVKWPVLSCLIIGMDSHFHILKRFDSLLCADQTKVVEFNKIEIVGIGNTVFNVYGKNDEKNESRLYSINAIDILGSKLPDADRISVIDRLFFETTSANSKNEKYLYL